LVVSSFPNVIILFLSVTGTTGNEILSYGTPSILSYGTPSILSYGTPSILSYGTPSILSVRLVKFFSSPTSHALHLYPLYTRGQNSQQFLLLTLVFFCALATKPLGCIM